MIGLLIIAFMSTALIGPYLIDWTSYRQTFEREAGAYLGRPVTVAGKANVRLLPTPTLNFTDVRVGDQADPELTIENVRAELELPALLRGDIRVIQMRVDRPILRLDIATLAGPLGSSGGLSQGRLDPDAVSLDSLEINSGQVQFIDSRTGRQWLASSMNAQIEARSLSGPGKIEGGLVLDGEAISFRASAGRIAPNGALPLKVSLFPARLPFITRLSGKLQTGSPDGVYYEGGFTTAELTDLHAEEENGTEGADGANAADGGEQAILESAGTFRLGTDSLDIPEIQITYGLRGRPLQLAGRAGLRFGDEPYFDISLEARQIDVDRALGGGPNDPVSISRAMSAFVENLKSLPLAPIDGELHLDAKGVVVGGSVIQAVGADLRPEADGWTVDILSAVLPGQTRIDLTGALSVSQEPGFVGRGKVRSKQPSAFASWWRGSAGRTSLIDEFTIDAALELTESQLTASDLIADIDGGAVRGSIGMRRFQEAGQQVFVDVGLTASALDLEKAQVLAGLFAGRALSGGQIDRMAISLEADRLFAGGVDAQNVVLKGTLEKTIFDLKVLSVDNLAGASISARGRVVDPFGKPGGRINADIAAQDLSGTARFLKGLFPDQALVSRFNTIAADLSPAKAEFLLSARQTDNHLTLDLTGTFAGTRVSLEMAGTGQIGDLSTLRGKVDGLVIADQSAKLLRQGGFDVLPLDVSGPARIALQADGVLGSDFSVRTDGTLAGIDFDFAGNGKIDGNGLSIDGTAGSKSNSIDDLLVLSGIALPGVGNGHPLALSGDLSVDGSNVSIVLKDSSFDEGPVSGSLLIRFGDLVRINGDLSVGDLSVPHVFSMVSGQLPQTDEGNWPDAPFARAIPDNIAVDISLSSDQLDFGLGPAARNADMRFSLSASSVNLDRVQADWAGGRVKGEFGASATDRGLDYTMRMALADVALQDVIWRTDGRAVAQGKLDSSFSVTGSGRSFAGLVSTMSGSGSFGIRDGLIRSINPMAFSSIVRATDTGLVLTPERVRSVFEGYLDAGSLPFERASGSFSVSSGAIRVSTVSVDATSATALGSGMLDLNTRTLSSDWSLKVDPGSEKVTGAEPEVGILFSGSVADPRRDVDVTPLMGYLTVRAFEREVNRIEALQANIQERERLVRLLKVQREQAAQRILQAEEEARRAEEEARRAAEEEARRAAEEARRAVEEEARRAAEAARLDAEEEARQAAEQQTQNGPEKDPPFDGLDIESIIRNNEPLIEDNVERLPPANENLKTGSVEQDVGLPPLKSQTVDDRAVFTEKKPVPAVRRRVRNPAPAPLDKTEDEGPIYKTLPNGVTIKIR